MRIAIVNDMALACEALRRVVLSQPGNQIAWTARDGLDAVERVVQDRPDLVLMDLMMPRMNGAEATRRIMAESPCPIVIVTATVAGHMNKVYEAMGHGALDAVDTPTIGTGGSVEGASALLDKIGMVAKLFGTSSCAVPIPPPRAAPSDAPGPLGRLVLLGASTGGPGALADVLSALPKRRDACGIIIQHVDAAFAPGLAHWLGEMSGQRVEPALEGEQPAPGRWLLAATNDHLVLSAGRRLHYTREPVDLCYRPSVDVFFASVAAYWPEPGVAVLLTGMGRDGAEGLLKLRRLNWHTIAQDEATSVVYGMPRAAAEIGAAIRVLPVSRIAQEIGERLGGSEGIRGKIPSQGS